MNYSSIEDYLPFLDLEFLYKSMYKKYPELSLDKPKTFQLLEAITGNLEGYQKLYLMDPSGFTPDNILLENIFPLHCDVVINRHLRYSPALLHSHSFFEIVYIVEGFCTNQVSGQNITLKKGDVCIIAPDTMHAVSAFFDDSLIMNLLVRTSTFETAFFGTLANNDTLASFFSRALYASSSESYLLFHTMEDIEIQHIFFEMYQEFHSALHYSERMMNAMATTFFITLLRKYEKNVIVPNPQGNGLENNIIFILNYLFYNFQNISLKELSLFFNYSERQMARILKDYTGKTFVAIIQDIKLQKACELLANPNVSIQKIVDIIGYSNVSHFYNLFKTQYNMTPTEYRARFYTR